MKVPPKMVLILLKVLDWSFVLRETKTQGETKSYLVGFCRPYSTVSVQVSQDLLPLNDIGEYTLLNLGRRTFLKFANSQQTVLLQRFALHGLIRQTLLCADTLFFTFVCCFPASTLVYTGVHTSHLPCQKHSFHLYGVHTQDMPTIKQTTLT